tara:strand:- start:522 stop:1457 length:936 start_codon:yes stop_codon:yes gene_type:complete
MSKKISICIPVLNEAANIDLIYNEISKIINEYKGQYIFEFIFTDNNSSDGTFEKIKILKKNFIQNIELKAFQFSKNIGKEKSLYYGFSKASGDAVIQIDADLEDPPYLIKDFIKKWEEGYKIVYGIRKKRKNDSFKFLRFLFYRILNIISSNNFPLDAGDFRLCDKEVIKEILKVNDEDPYLRGLISSIGFSHIGVEHDRNYRVKNKSKFNFFSYFNNAINAVVNHSIMPLRIASFLGFAVFFLCFVLTLFYFISFFISDSHEPGFTTQTILILTGISLNSLFLGILGEYVGRITRHIKKNDMFVIKDKII